MRHFLTGFATLLLGSLLLTGVVRATIPTVHTGDYDKRRQPWAVLRTSHGNVLIKLVEKQAPRTVRHFIGLARGTVRWKHPKTGKWHNKPFYNGLKFHRVLKGLLIQTGCPTNTGRHGPGFRIEQELNPLLKHNRVGTVSMVTVGEGKVGSQFFVTLRPMPWLNYRSVKGQFCSNFRHRVRCTRNWDCKKYARAFPSQSTGKAECKWMRRYRGTSVFGYVISGMDVIRKLEALPLTATGKPKKPASLVSVDIYRSLRWKRSWLRSFRPVRPKKSSFRPPVR